MTRRGISLFVAALLLPMPAARTAMLGKDDCAKLKVEQGELETSGARGNMGRGPQWAKTNLEPEKLDQIRRLLEIDEQLLFRCHGKPLVTLPKDPEPDPAAPEGTAKEPAAKAAKGPKAAKKETLKKAAATPAEPVAKAGAKHEPAAKKTAPAPKATSDKAQSNPDKKTVEKAAAAKKTKAKAKADDAYRPPTQDPGANPFAHQLAPKP